MARDITKLHPKVQELAVKLVAECEKKGLHIKITDCVRTREEQNGIDASRTNCKYPNSYHNWGLAFDFCRYEDVDGDGIISDDVYNQKGDFFRKVGQVGKSLGLDWGGDFKSIYDGPHFEYKGFGTRSQIQRKFDTPEKWFASWNAKTKAVNPYVEPTRTIYYDAVNKKVVCKGEDVKYVQWELIQDGITEVIIDGKKKKLTIDGSCGKITDAAIREYQCKHRLTIDGKCGPKTRDEMNKQ